MHARFAIAASIAAAALLGVELIAQTTTTSPQTTPPMTSVLAGKKLTPPIRGEAALEWVDPKPEKKGDMVITKMTVETGTRVKPGLNVGRGKDDTLFAKIAGKIVFKDRGSMGKFVMIEPLEAK